MNNIFKFITIFFFHLLFLGVVISADEQDDSKLKIEPLNDTSAIIKWKNNNTFKMMILIDQLVPSKTREKIDIKSGTDFYTLKDLTANTTFYFWLFDGEWHSFYYTFKTNNISTEILPTPLMSTAEPPVPVTQDIPATTTTTISYFDLNNSTEILSTAELPVPVTQDIPAATTTTTTTTINYFDLNNSTEILSTAEPPVPVTQDIPAIITTTIKYFDLNNSTKFRESSFSTVTNETAVKIYHQSSNLPKSRNLIPQVVSIIPPDAKYSTQKYKLNDKSNSSLIFSPLIPGKNYTLIFKHFINNEQFDVTQEIKFQTIPPQPFNITIKKYLINHIKITWDEFEEECLFDYYLVTITSQQVIEKNYFSLTKQLNLSMNFCQFDNLIVDEIYEINVQTISGNLISKPASVIIKI